MGDIQKYRNNKTLNFLHFGLVAASSKQQFNSLLWGQPLWSHQKDGNLTKALAWLEEPSVDGLHLKLGPACIKSRPTSSRSFTGLRLIDVKRKEGFFWLPLEHCC